MPRLPRLTPYSSWSIATPWREDAGLLLHRTCIFALDFGDLRHQAPQLAHGVGHEGAQKRLHRLRLVFYILGDRTLIQDWVRTCAMCHRNKTEALQLVGLLQPLEVPSQVWADISLDFIEGLPKVGGKSLILTVVDRFSKYAHFLALGHPYTATSVARAFFDGVVCLHGFLSSIVSARNPVFTGRVAGPLQDGGCDAPLGHRLPSIDGWPIGGGQQGDRPRAWVE